MNFEDKVPVEAITYRTREGFSLEMRPAFQGQSTASEKRQRSNCPASRVNVFFFYKAKREGGWELGCDQRRLTFLDGDAIGGGTIRYLEGDSFDQIS